MTTFDWNRHFAARRQRERAAFVKEQQRKTRVRPRTRSRPTIRYTHSTQPPHTDEMGDRAPPMGFFEGGGRPPRGFDDRFPPRGREMGFGDRPRGPKPLMGMHSPSGPERGMNGAYGPGPRGRPGGPYDGPREHFQGRPFGPRSPSPGGRFDPRGPREPSRPGPPAPAIREMVEYIKDRIAQEVEVRRPDLLKDGEGRPRGDFPREMEGRPRGDFPREMEGRPRGEYPREMEGRPRGEFPREMEGRPRGEFPREMEGRPRGDIPMEGRPRGEFPREIEGRPRGEIPRDIEARRGDFPREMEGRPRGDLPREMEGRSRADMLRDIVPRELEGRPRAGLPRELEGRRDIPREMEGRARGDFPREMEAMRSDFPGEMDARRGEFPGRRGDFAPDLEGRGADWPKEVEGRRAEWLNELEGRRVDWMKEMDGGRAEFPKEIDRRAEWPKELEGRRSDWDKELVARRAEWQKELEGRRADWQKELEGRRGAVDWPQSAPRRSRSRSPLRHPHPSPMGVTPNQRPSQALKASESRSRAPDKPLQTFGLKVQNFPVEVNDEVLQQTLFQKFRKYGFVSSVEVHGQAEDRYALVFFYRQQDQVDALIKGRRDDLLGRLVKITPWIGRETKGSGRPLTDWDEKTDEFHPRASRTLLIGNLDLTITPEKLGSICERFGDVLDVEMCRPQEGSPTRSAFIEFCDMYSVCRAGKALDGELFGKHRVKTEFGKSIVTSCVWLDGLPLEVTQEYLMQRFSRYGQVAKAVYDRLRGRALILYTRKEDAVTAVQETRGAQISGWRLKVDFASDRARLTFCRDMEESGQDTGDFLFV